MSITLKRLPIGSVIGDYVCPPDEENSFKIFALIHNNRNTTFDDINKLEKNDRGAARKSFVKFHKNSITGQPFRGIFDGTQYHTGHEFNYRGNSVTIWRLWLAGDIRIYIYFLPNRTIVVLKTSAKRENSLSESEMIELETITKMVIDCSNDGLVNIKEG